MQVEMQETAHLSMDDMATARALEKLAKHYARCEAVVRAKECNANPFEVLAKIMRFYAGDWFVYRGGSHIAIHRNDGDCYRVLFIH